MYLGHLIVFVVVVVGERIEIQPALNMGLQSGVLEFWYSTRLLLHCQSSSGSVLAGSLYSSFSNTEKQSANVTARLCIYKRFLLQECNYAPLPLVSQ